MNANSPTRRQGRVTAALCSVQEPMNILREDRPKAVVVASANWKRTVHIVSVANTPAFHENRTLSCLTRNYRNFLTQLWFNYSSNPAVFCACNSPSLPHRRLSFSGRQGRPGIIGEGLLSLLRVFGRQALPYSVQPSTCGRSRPDQLVRLPVGLAGGGSGCIRPCRVLFQQP